MGLAETVHCDNCEVGSEGSCGDVLAVVEKESVVNFVGEDDEVVLACYLEDVV